MIVLTIDARMNTQGLSSHLQDVS